MKSSAPRDISINDLIAGYSKGEFALPSYQRDEIWSPLLKQELIRTVLEGFPIGQLVLRNLDKSSDDQSYNIFNIIDGSQRVRTLKHYRDGDFELGECTVGKDRLDGMSFKELPKPYPTIFNGSTVHARVLSGITEGEEIEYFKRIQNAVKLKPVDILRNTNCPIRDLAQSMLKEEKLTTKTTKKPKLYADFQFYLQTLINLHRSISEKEIILEGTQFHTTITLMLSTAITKNDKSFMILNEIDNLVRGRRSSTHFYPIASQKLGFLYMALYQMSLNYDIEKYGVVLINKFYDVLEQIKIEDASNGTQRFRGLEDRKGMIRTYEYVFDKIKDIQIPARNHTTPRYFSSSITDTLYANSVDQCCSDCKKHLLREEATADHIKPWSKGGETTLENGRILCRPCNSKKGNG